MFTCIVDCRVDGRLENEYLTLNIWGRPVFSYVTEECIDSGCFRRVYLLTDSEYAAEMARALFGEKIIVTDTFVQTGYSNPEEAGFFVVSGRALMLKRDTIRNAVKSYRDGCTRSVRLTYSTETSEAVKYPSFLGERIQTDINVFVIVDTLEAVYGESDTYLLDDTESMVINTKNDFELALVLKKKEMNAVILRKAIQDRIAEKEKIFRGGPANSVCLIGHSQLDDWDVEELCGMQVRNCGIRGISSFEYGELILRPELLDCTADAFVVMHGTNDIVGDYEISEIVESSLHSVSYISEHNSEAKIFFVSCLHVNGRADRNNMKIDELNKALRIAVENVGAGWIDTSGMDDKFGNLKSEYTRDGLHLSDTGYSVLKGLIEKKIEEALS